MDWSFEQDILRGEFMKYMVTTTRVEGDKCLSYWLPINKNGNCAIHHAIDGRAKWDDRLAIRRDKLKWMVVRNPFSKIYSCWRDKVDRKTTFLPALSDSVKPGDSFETFIDWVIGQPDDWTTDNHFTSQECNTILSDFQPDVILRFETLAHDWKLLAQRIGVNTHLSAKNCTRSNFLDHTVHAAAYTESLREKVAGRYRMDFQRFGYDPERL